MTKIPAKTPRPIGSTDNVFPGSVKAAGSPDAEGCSAAAVAPASVAAADVRLDDASFPLAWLLLAAVWDAWSEPDTVVDAVSVMAGSVAVAESVDVVESVAVAESVIVVESVTEAGSTEVVRD
jgi:hypothetical protein